MKLRFAITATAFSIALAISGPADAQPSSGAPKVKIQGSVVTLSTGQSAAATLDYANASPIPLPQASIQPISLLDSLLEAETANPLPSEPPGVSPGGIGNGRQTPEILVPAPNLTNASDSGGGIGSMEYGTNNHVYTTNRVNAQANTTTRYYPYRAAGKLFFSKGGTTNVCSAALIKPGIVVTAAHCVADFGRQQFYSDWQFSPGYDNGTAPYGQWTVKSVLIMRSYYDGTDSCYQSGVVCQNDIAVITLNSKSSPTYPGINTGWLSYGWNGYSYANNQVLISQLGYPVALDGGYLMERTDSQGFVSSTMSGNTIIGSLQTGGSSGGPWVVNLGIAPVLNGTSFGSAADRNVVVGVTSWGYTSGSQKEQGASPFTSNNIVTLVNTACTATPGAC